MGLIKPLKVQEIEQFAKMNQVADPRQYIRKLPKNIRLKIRDFISKNPEILYQYINYDSIIEQLRKHRPDLIIALEKPINRAWFERFITLLQTTIKQI